MPRGMRDWGIYSPVESIFKGMDMGEVATRLGSVVGFDRGGTALFVDDCSSGLTKWRIVEWSGEKVRPQYGYNIFGGYSIRLEDDGLDSHRPEIYTGIPLYQNVKAGFELVANLVYENTVIILDLEFDDGEKCKVFKVRLANNAGTIEILDETNTWQLVGSFNKMPSGAMWTFFLKMVVNEKDSKYERIRLNQKIIDVSNYSCRITSSWIPNNIFLDVSAGFEVADKSGGINVNSVIFTINE